MAQKIKKIILSFLIIAGALLFSPLPALAATAGGGGATGGGSGDGSGDCANTTTGNTVNAAKVNKCLQSDPIVTDINTVVNFLSIGVGVVVVAMIVLGGVQYIMAGDSPDALSKAKKRITNALIALIAFLFAFAFLQWIVPGGVLG